MPNGAGGGGGGGTIVGVSNSFTGAAQQLEVLGDHAYGYSGVVDIGSTETDMLNFTTGNFYFVGTVQFNYIELNAYHFRYRFYLNDAILQGFVEPSGATGAPNVSTTIIPIIIPAYTVVKCTAQNLVDATLQEQVCSMIGRIYRG